MFKCHLNSRDLLICGTVSKSSRRKDRNVSPPRMFVCSILPIRSGRDRSDSVEQRCPMPIAPELEEWLPPANMKFHAKPDSRHPFSQNGDAILPLVCRTTLMVITHIDFTLGMEADRQRCLEQSWRDCSRKAGNGVCQTQKLGT